MSAKAHKPEVRARDLFELDKLCDEFESQWHSGARPAIEDFLSRSQSDPRIELFEELLALEVSLRKQHGDSLTPDEYVRRFPEFDTVVGKVFAAGQEWQQKTTVDEETLVQSGLQLPPSLGSFGDYELLAEVGRGGMGVVYKAYQPSLDRTVAIKMILASQSTSKQFVERFRTEAKTLAKLLHPGIVPIFEVGELNGQHYFSMEYVEGQSLSHLMMPGRLTTHDAARLVREVAEVIHFAHERGILHRDIKPSNILVSPQGRARVMDFGLAKHLESDSQNTRSGEVLGTPSYMSPEQASGRWSEVDRFSDVYSLGAVLYALLVRKPPFQSDSPLGTLLAVVQSPAVPPSSINPAVEPELERICLKCLEKDPARRYSTAAELARDLDHYLQKPQVSPIVPAKLQADDRRTVNRSLLWIGAAALAVIAVVAVVITFKTKHGTLIVEVPDDAAANLQVRATKDGAVEVADQNSEWKLRLEEGNYKLELAGGDNQFKIVKDSVTITRNTDARVAVTRKEIPGPASPSRTIASIEIPAGPARTFAPQEPLGKQSLVERPGHIKGALSWTIETAAHRAPVTSLSYFPSGAQVLSSGRDGTLRIWDVATGKMLRVLVSSDELESCDVSPSGRYLAAAGANRLEIWDSNTNRLLNTIPLEPGRPTMTRWSSDGRHVACAIEQRGVQLCDTVAGKMVDLLAAEEPILALAWNRDGNQIAFATKKNGTEIFEAASGERLHRLHAPEDRVTSLAWSNDSSRLVTAGASLGEGAFAIRVWSLGNQEPVSRQIPTRENVVQASWHDNDQRILLVFQSGHGELRHSESGEVMRTYENRSQSPYSAVSLWSPDGSSATSADSSGALVFRTTRTGTEIRREGMAVHFGTPTWNAPMPQVAWSAVGDRIAFATPNAQQGAASVPGLWSISGETVFKAASGNAKHHLAVSIAWSDDGELLATGGSDPQTIIWNKDGTQRQVLATGGWVTSLGFEPKSHRLAVGTQGGEIQLWDLEQNSAKKLASPNKAWVMFRWSADGKRIASAGYDGNLSLWNVETGEAIHSISKDAEGNGLGEIHSVDLSRDGKYLAVGTLGRVCVFGAKGGQQVHSLAAEGWVYGVQFSPDSQRLAAANGGKLSIWSVMDGNLQHQLPQPHNASGVAWSPDGQSIACSTSARVSVYRSNGNKQMDLIPLGMTDGIGVTPEGYVRGGKPDQLTYILQTDAGQIMVPPAEMESRWGWKNQVKP